MSVLSYDKVTHCDNNAITLFSTELILFNKPGFSEEIQGHKQHHVLSYGHESLDQTPGHKQNKPSCSLSIPCCHFNLAQVLTWVCMG